MSYTPDTTSPAETPGTASAWPIVEQRITGITCLAGAVAFAVVQAATDSTPRLIEALALGVAFGSILYIIETRSARRAVGRPPTEALTDRREAIAVTRQRMFLANAAWLLLVAGVSFLLGSAGFGLLFAGGTGLLGLLNARWLRRWEHDHNVQLLRARRSIWPFPSPKDLYALPSSTD
jgi:hypothetical protein